MSVSDRVYEVRIGLTQNPNYFKVYLFHDTYVQLLNNWRNIRCSMLRSAMAHYEVDQIIMKIPKSEPKIDRDQSGIYGEYVMVDVSQIIFIDYIIVKEGDQ